MIDRRSFLAGAGSLTAAGLWLPETGFASAAPLPPRAIHSDVIGPAAEVAEIRLYSRPEGATHVVSTPGQLKDALARAGSGDVIRLAPGHYGEFSTKASAGRGRLRIVSETWRGATFDKLYTGGDGLWWEGIDVTGGPIVLRGRNTGVRHSRALWADFRKFRDLTVEDSVFDGNYDEQTNIKDGSGVVVRRTIFCRAKGPDLVQTNDIEDVSFENCVFFDLRQPSNSGEHSDIFQCWGPRASGAQKWRFYRCMFYTHARRDIRSNQGLFLSDAKKPAYSGVDIQQCLFGAANGRSRFGITVQFNGGGNVIRQNTLFGPISTEKKKPADNSGTVIEGNITSEIKKRGGGSFGVERNNIAFRSRAGLFRPPSHDMNAGLDWRDYWAPNQPLGARPFLEHLVRTWG